MKTISTKGADWEEINKMLTLQYKMKLIKDRKYLWYRVPGHTLKECQKWIIKQPIYTTEQVLCLQHTNKPVIAKNDCQGETMAKP